MGQYIYTIVCCTVFVAVILAVAPGADSSKTGKHIAFIGALAIAVTMLSPVPGLLTDEDLTFGEWEDSEAVPKDEAAKGEYYASSAGMALSEIYGTDLSDICAEVTVSDSGEVAEIVLNIEGSVYYSTEEAGKVLSDIYDMNIAVKDGADGK